MQARNQAGSFCLVDESPASAGSLDDTIDRCVAEWRLHFLVVRSWCERETGSLDPLQMTLVTASSAKSREVIQGERERQAPSVHFLNL